MIRALLLMLLIGGCQATTLVRTACGTTLPGTDPYGNTWGADVSLLPGGSIWGNAITQQPPFNHLRYSNPALTPFQYVFTVPTGSYNVTLDFYEPSRTAAGSRVFNVSINGVMQLTNFDVFAQVGKGSPLSLIFPTVAIPNPTGTAATITVLYQGVVSNAVCSGIQIDTPPPAPLLTITAGPGIQIMSPPLGGGPSIISTDSAAIPIYSVGLAASRPTACSFGQEYMATDSMVLSYCITAGSPGVWSGVPAPVAGLLVCSGSGTGPPPTLQQGTNPPTPPSVNGVPAVAGVGWDCAAMMAVSITKTDGTTLSILGTLMAVPTNPALIWTPYQW